MPSFQACSSPLVDTQSMHSKSVYAKECRGVFVVSGSFGWVSCVVLLVCCVCVLHNKEWVDFCWWVVPKMVYSVNGGLLLVSLVY